MKISFRFIDLFCGIGAFHQALRALGGNCVYACDIDKDACKTYARNYGIEPDSDITKADETQIPEHDVLCAGFPCQAFSKAGKRLGFNDSTKGTLFFDVMRIVRYHKPKYVLLENVRNLATHDRGNTWKVIYESLRKEGYYLQETPVLFSPHYIGIPQHRERVFVMAVRGEEYPDFRFNHDNIVPCSIDSVLQDDSEIDDIGEYVLDDGKMTLIDTWNRFLAGVKETPMFPVWTEALKESTELIDGYSGMPKWKQDIIRKNVLLYLKNKDFIDMWLRESRESCPLFFGAKAKLEWQVGDVLVAERNIWDNIIQFRPSGLRVKSGTYFPALVAIVQTSVVGKRKRFLTPRECARLQSFPDDFIMDDKKGQAYKQFGNSINVEVARLFASYLFGDESVRMNYSKSVQFPDAVESNKLF